MASRKTSSDFGTAVMDTLKSGGPVAIILVLAIVVLTLVVGSALIVIANRMPEDELWMVLVALLVFSVIIVALWRTIILRPQFWNILNILARGSDNPAGRTIQLNLTEDQLESIGITKKLGIDLPASETYFEESRRNDGGVL